MPIDKSVLEKNASNGHDREELELASFLVPPSSETPDDMMSYHIEASKRLFRSEERERDRRRIVRLPAGWDMQKLKQTLKLALAVILCLSVTVRILHKVGAAREERYQEQLARTPVNFRGHNLIPATVEKVKNYRSGKNTLIVNLHLGIMHSSTEYRDDIFYEDVLSDEDYICKEIGRSYLVNQQAPRFHCRIDIHQDQLHVEMTPGFPPKTPWAKDETSENIQAIRKFWHMIDWYNYDADIIEEEAESQSLNGERSTTERVLADTDWRDPNLISILVMTDPMERLLADSWVFFERTFPSEDVPKIIRDRSVSSKPWWSFVKESPQNYVARQLGQRHSDTRRTSHKVLLEHAKELMQEFTFVLDNACLEKGVEKVADILNIVVDEPLPPRSNATRTPSKSMPADVYRRLVQLNELDIELYKWSKGISLVQC